MQNKIFLVFLSFVCIGFSPVFSQTNAPFNGIYTIYSLGSSYASSHEKLSHSVNIELVDDVLSFSKTLNSSTTQVNNSLVGILGTGYGRTWDRLYLGAEIAFTGSTYQMTSFTNHSLQGTVALITLNTNTDIQTQTKISPVQFTFTLRPGFLLRPQTLLFGRVGGTVTSVSMQSTINTTGKAIVPILSYQQDFPSSSFTDGISRKRIVPHIGGGLEQKINQRWAVRFEYLYTDYGRLQSSTMKTTDLFLLNRIPVGTYHVTTTNKVKIIEQTVLLGLTCHLEL